MTLLAPTLQSFFTDRLAQQRRVSPQTIASYRDSLRMLVVFVHHRTSKQPHTLGWDDLTPEVISAFLDHLEVHRGNSPRTRNLRLTAIRSLFAYASLRHPEHAALIQRVLAIPAKRFDKPIVSSSRQARSTRSSTLPTWLGGKDAETGPCCSWPLKPGYGSPSSPD